MSDDDEVTRWLSGLARGEDLAVGEIWQRYFQRLVCLARSKLREGSGRCADEEDVALSAFQSFCAGAAAGKFPRLEDRHDLWKLLVTITARKVGQLVRRSKRKKRGGGTVRGESVFGSTGRDDAGGLGEVLGPEPTPEIAVSAAEQFEHLLAVLGDEQLRRIALRKLEGYTNDEIAAEMTCAPRTVERKLQRIRDLWSRELAGCE